MSVWQYWSIESERRFLDGLGTHRQKDKRGLPRRELLKLYLANFDIRANWGTMDKEQVRDYARASLEG